MKVKLETKRRLIMFVWRRLDREEPLQVAELEPREVLSTFEFGFTPDVTEYYEEEWEDGDNEETAGDD